MPTVSTPLRVLTGSIIVVLAAAGCQTLDDAGRVIGRADLVNELAARLDGAGERTYSADYQLPGGKSASIAQSQSPPRAAYIYPGGKLTVTADATTECVSTGGRSTCTLKPPPTYANKPAVAMFQGANARGLVTPPVVINLLTAAALDPDATVEQHDTTVAGRHATCVRVRQVTNAAAPSFDTCITTEGVLGSFAGTVDGTEVDIALSRYREVVDSDAFDLPPGAGVVDRRESPGA